MHHLCAAQKPFQMCKPVGWRGGAASCYGQLCRTSTPSASAKLHRKSLHRKSLVSESCTSSGVGGGVGGRLSSTKSKRRSTSKGKIAAKATTSFLEPTLHAGQYIQILWHLQKRGRKELAPTWYTAKVLHRAADDDAWTVRFFDQAQMTLVFDVGRRTASPFDPKSGKWQSPMSFRWGMLDPRSTNNGDGGAPPCRPFSGACDGQTLLGAFVQMSAGITGLVHRRHRAKLGAPWRYTVSLHDHVGAAFAAMGSRMRECGVRELTQGSMRAATKSGEVSSLKIKPQELAVAATRPQWLAQLQHIVDAGCADISGLRLVQLTPEGTTLLASPLVQWCRGLGESASDENCGSGASAPDVSNGGIKGAREIRVDVAKLWDDIDVLIGECFTLSGRAHRTVLRNGCYDGFALLHGSDVVGMCTWVLHAPTFEPPVRADVASPPSPLFEVATICVRERWRGYGFGAVLGSAALGLMSRFAMEGGFVPRVVAGASRDGRAFWQALGRASAAHAGRCTTAEAAGCVLPDGRDSTLSKYLPEEDARAWRALLEWVEGATNRPLLWMKSRTAVYWQPLHIGDAVQHTAELLEKSMKKVGVKFRAVVKDDTCVLARAKQRADS